MFRIERREKEGEKKVAFLIKPILRRRRTEQSRAVSLKWYTWNIFHNLWKMAKLSKIYLGGCPWKSEDGNSLGWLCAVNGLWESPLIWHRIRADCNCAMCVVPQPILLQEWQLLFFAVLSTMVFLEIVGIWFFLLCKAAAVASCTTKYTFGI